MSIGLKMLEAVRAEIVGARSKATANLEVLLSNPVGIGEHVDLVSDVHNLISEIAETCSLNSGLSQKSLIKFERYPAPRT